MAIASYHRYHERSRAGGGPPATGYLPNPACYLTDQGATPEARDLAWCIRRRWRVIYYSFRRAAGKPLWDGVDDFDVLMTDVLLTLSSGFEPIAPIRSAAVAAADQEAMDARKDRYRQLSCRVFRTPVLEQRPRVD